MSENDGNNHWDFKKAQADKKVCATCNCGVGPFLVQGSPDLRGVLPIAAVVICQNTQSIYYMRLGTQIASCECWKEKAAPTEQPRIVVAHKPVPPLKVSELKGEKK